MLNWNEGDRAREQTFMESVMHRGFMACNWSAFVLCVLSSVASITLFVDAALEDSEMDHSGSEKYWLSSTVVSFTSWFFLVLCLNFVGSKYQITNCVLISGVLSIIVFLTEIIFIVLVVTDTIHPKNWRDPSGSYRRIEDYLSNNTVLFGCLVSALGSFQLLFIIFTFCNARTMENDINSSKPRVNSDQERWNPFLDEHNDEVIIERARSPSKTNGCFDQSHRKAQHDWSVRMKQQYGLDMNQFTYDPWNPEGRDARVRNAAPPIVVQRSWSSESIDKQKCSIM